MDRRQGTLDQVFRARKRKLTSPVTPSSSKSKKYNYERASAEVVEISPRKKGNLEAYLFTAKHEDPPTCAVRLGAIREPGLPELRRGEVQFSSSKPWLTPCSLASRPSTAEALKDPNKFEDIGPVEGRHSDRISTQSPIKTQVIQPIQSPLKTQLLYPQQTPGVAESDRGREFSGTAVEEAGHCTDTSVENKLDVAAAIQLSQFSNEFLSLCSGIPASNCTKTEAAELLTLQQKRKDEVALSDHAGRKKLCPELIPTQNNQVPQEGQFSASVGQSENALLETDRCRSLEPTRDARDGQVEQQVSRRDSCIEFREDDVSSKGATCNKSQSSTRLEKTQLSSSPAGSCELLARHRPHNLLLGKSQTLTGSTRQVACNASNNESLAGSRIAVFKFHRGTYELGIKQVCTPPEVVLTQVRIATELGQEERLGGKAATSGVSSVSTPLGREFSKSSPSHKGEAALSTPESSSEQEPTSTSSHEINAAGSYYRSSLFSPGDEFWEEAIKNVMASNVDVPHQSSVEKRTHSLSLNLHPGNDLLRPRSAKGGLKYQVSASHGSVPLKQELRSQTGKLRSVDSTDPRQMLSSEKVSPPVPKSERVLAVDGQDEVKINRSNGTLSDCYQKANRDGTGLGGWLKQLDTNPVSPLPVRHFDFSGKGEKVDHRILNDEAQEKSNSTNIMAKEALKEEVGTKKNNMKDIALAVNKVAPEDPLLDPAVLSTVVPKPVATSKGTERAANATLETPLKTPTTKAVGTKGKGIMYSKFLHRGASTTTSGLSSSGTVEQRSLELTDWLPKEVAAIYAKKGMKQLYAWQLECLQLEGVLYGRNLVYSASTSAGKSLVAELLMIRRVVSTGRMALLVLPFVSICSEKAEHLEAVLEPLGKRVRNFFGTQGSATVPRDTCVAVCTIEKANSLINKLLEENRLSEVGLIVIDELHMVGDRDRGYLLELLLTKIRYACGEFDKIGGLSQEKALANALSQTSSKSESKADLQVVGMSATMPNIDAVARWLQAALYETDFRPVPLEEFIKVGNAIYNRNMEISRIIRKQADLGGKDPDHVVELCHEVVKEGHSVLVFCASRKACETSAVHIAKYLPSVLSPQTDGTSVLKDGGPAVEELRKSSSGLDPVLGQTLPSGVAYHHAGLTVEEREVVERCFKEGVVRVLTATSTLAAGVNLPARRVIFRQPKVGRDFLDGTKYRQMAGRAGRAGIDTKGESVLICKPEEVKRMITVLSKGCQPLQSCLTDDKIGMMRALLEVVAGGIVQTPQDVHRYVRCTLFNSTESFDQVVKSVQDSLCWLCRKKFVEWNKETQVYSTTPLGRAAFGSSLSPDESLVVFEDLAKAREGFVLASDLHLVYQVTPIYVELEPDWSLFYQKFVELSTLDQAVGSRVGVLEPFLMRMAHGAPPGSASRSKGISRSPPMRNRASPLLHGTVEGKFTGKHQTMDALRVCRRFYVALMLSKLVQEVPLMEVSESFKVPRGTVQALQVSAGRFAAMVSGFCERLGWHDLEGLVSKFQTRVSFGVRSEIVELTEIPFIKGARARALYKSGFRTVQAVAEATFPELLKALSEASPWAAHDDSRGKIQQRKLIGVVWKIKVGAQRIVLDRAEEARIAAFSAIRALGVDVPSSLWPSIQTTVTAAMIGEDAQEDSPEPDVIKGAPLVDRPQPGANLSQKGRAQVLVTTTEVKGSAPPQAGTVTVKVTSCISEGDRAEQGDKENQWKGGKTEDMSHDRHGGQVGANVESVIQKYKKAAGSTLNLNCLFGGVDFMKDRSLEEDVSEGLKKVERVNCGPIDVDKMTGGFETFLQQWMAVDEFCFDLNYRNQTTEISIQVFDIEGIAICWQDSPVYYVSLSKIPTDGSHEEVGREGLLDKSIGMMDINPEPGNVLELLNIIEVRWKKISSVLSRHGSRKVIWDLKNQLRALHHAGISHTLGKPEYPKNAEVFTSKQKDLHRVSPIILGEPYLDVHIAAWLLWPDEESSHNLTLEQEVKKRLPGEVAANASRAGRWTNQMGGVSHNGCCRRVAQIRALHSALWKLLISEGLHHPLLDIEMPMVKVLAVMESSGIGVDMEACCHIRQVIEQRIKSLEARAHQLAGTPFALSVPADVANTLYKHLKLPVPPGCKKGKQHPSTNKHALDLLRPQHPIAGVIQEHRKLSKLLHSTLASIVVWAKSTATVRAVDVKERVKHRHQIFGRWLQTSTATGRLSMEEPNLQCVENTICCSGGDGFVQDGNGAIGDKVELNTRQLFVPTQERWILLSADYSQIEVRLLAHFSEDPALIALLSRPSGDLFRMIASQWTGVLEAAVTDKQREQTKKMVYGILYGMGVHALAEHLDCSVAEASLYLERFRSAFSGVQSWLQQACLNCRKNGYVMTLGGRKRFLDKINSGTHAEQAKAERQAVNSICQGSAADLIKMAMIKLHAGIVGDVGEGSHSIIKGHCRLLLQIHDELVMEVDKTFLKEVSDTLRSCMEGAAKLKVPLRVKLQVGKTWGSLNSLDDSSMKALL